eukprot:IDg20124t1
MIARMAGAVPDQALRALAVRARYAQPTLFVVGGPGSGKGSICARLAQKRGWDAFSTGDLLRAQGDRDPRLRDMLQAGQVVPPAMSAKAVLRRVLQSRDAPLVIVDGFPRDVDAAALWTAASAPVTPALFLECDANTLRARLAKRGRDDD